MSFSSSSRQVTRVPICDITSSSMPSSAAGRRPAASRYICASRARSCQRSSDRRPRGLRNLCASSIVITSGRRLWRGPRPSRSDLLDLALVDAAGQDVGDQHVGVEGAVRPNSRTTCWPRSRCSRMRLTESSVDLRASGTAAGRCASSLPVEDVQRARVAARCSWASSSRSRLVSSELRDPVARRRSSRQPLDRLALRRGACRAPRAGARSPRPRSGRSRSRRRSRRRRRGRATTSRSSVKTATRALNSCLSPLTSVAAPLRVARPAVLVVHVEDEVDGGAASGRCREQQARQERLAGAGLAEDAARALDEALQVETDRACPCRAAGRRRSGSRPPRQTRALTSASVASRTGAKWVGIGLDRLGTGELPIRRRARRRWSASAASRVVPKVLVPAQDLGERTGRRRRAATGASRFGLAAEQDVGDHAEEAALLAVDDDVAADGHVLDRGRGVEAGLESLR